MPRRTALCMYAYATALVILLSDCIIELIFSAPHMRTSSSSKFLFYKEVSSGSLHPVQLHTKPFHLIRFEVLIAVVMKVSIFWDITPCSPLKVNGRFGGTCRLHIQGQRISQAGNQGEGRWQVELCSETSVGFQRNTLRYIPELFRFTLLLSLTACSGRNLYA
jgi:hypothetical protein